MSFGYYRAGLFLKKIRLRNECNFQCISEVMGALVSVLMIWIVTGVLVYLAVQRIITNDYEIDATVMLITSALAIVFNIMSVTTFNPRLIAIHM